MPNGQGTKGDNEEKRIIRYSDFRKWSYQQAESTQGIKGKLEGVMEYIPGQDEKFYRFCVTLSDILSNFDKLFPSGLATVIHKTLTASRNGEKPYGLENLDTLNLTNEDYNNIKPLIRQLVEVISPSKEFADAGITYFNEVYGKGQI